MRQREELEVEPKADEARESWSKQEISAWMGKPPHAEWVRVEIAARIYAEAVGLTPDDLRQEALTRLLEGTRVIRKEYPIWKGIAGIIKSLAYAESVHRARNPTYGSISENADPLFGESGPSPEEIALWRIDGAAILRLIEKAMADRPVLRQLLQERVRIELDIAGENYITLTDAERRAAVKMFFRRLRKAVKSEPSNV